MLSISANTGWIEHAYGILEPIRQEKRNWLSIHNKNLFFLGVLKLKVSRMSLHMVKKSKIC